MDNDSNRWAWWSREFGMDGDPYLDFGPDWVDPSRENRTKSEAPYAYSEFFLWRDGGQREGWLWNFGPGVHADYSDRLWQWNYDKAMSAATEVSGRIDQWGKAECSRFLTLYFGRPVEAVACAEGCNPSSGYPYWIFWHRDAQETPRAR